MKNLLLDVILGLTLQRDSDSLQRAYLSSLMALYSSREAVVLKLVITGHDVMLEQILKLLDTEKHINDIPKMVPVDALVKRCIESKEIVVENVSPQVVNVSMPVVIGGSVISVVTMQGGLNIFESIDEITYLSKLYESFYTLIEESERDKLTGLYNRRTFDAKLAKMLSLQKSIREASQRNKINSEKRELESGETAWLVVLDIDLFKRVNDEFGHVAGDEVLLQLSQIMKDCFRQSDLLFRFGGEEFVVVLQPIPFDNVWSALERFRKTVADHQFPLVGTVTVSIGFAGIKANDYPLTIMDYADKALYFAKEHGRNCIQSYEQLLETGQLARPANTGTIDLF